jgi:predicted HTH domain antitoxin
VRITVDLPEAIAPKQEQATSEVIEAVALRAYAQRKISQGKLAEVLGISVWETERRLAALGISRPFTAADLQSDIETLKRLP